MSRYDLLVLLNSHECDEESNFVLFKVQPADNKAINYRFLICLLLVYCYLVLQFMSSNICSPVCVEGFWLGLPKQTDHWAEQALYLLVFYSYKSTVHDFWIELEFGVVIPCPFIWTCSTLKLVTSSGNMRISSEDRLYPFCLNRFWINREMDTVGKFPSL